VAESPASVRGHPRLLDARVPAEIRLRPGSGRPVRHPHRGERRRPLGESAVWSSRSSGSGFSWWSSSTTPLRRDRRDARGGLPPGQAHSPGLRSIVDRVRPSLRGAVSQTELARDRARLWQEAVRANIRTSVYQLRHRLGDPREARPRGRSRCVGAEYALDTGEVLWPGLNASPPPSARGINPPGAAPC
jgi:hypothetical protein